MTPSRTWWAVAAVASTLLVPGSAVARERCADGVFATERTPFTAAGARTVAGIFALQADELSLPTLCDTPAAATVRAKKRFDVVKARWDDCPSFPKTVKLSAKIDASECHTMTGVLRPQKAKPKRQRFTAVRLSPVALDLIRTLGDVVAEERMRHENFPYLIRPAAEAFNPELHELVALGPDAVPALLAEFRRTADFGDETRVSLLAVALELLGDPSAVPVLRDWLAQNLFTASLTWAPDLVTHAMKVLHGQDGVDTTSFTYDIDETLDALARARLGGTAAEARAATGVVSRPVVSAPRASNNCAKKIVVTGVDGEGQLREMAIPYATFDKDIHELIAEEQDPATRATLEEQQERWRSRDVDVYGGTDYVPIDTDADVSLKANCGGSVVQRMLNEVARRNGLAIRLGPGAASADDARELARTFGGSIAIEQLEPLLGMVSHDREGGKSAHVEIPIERVDAANLVVFSKDVQGIPRRHVVDTMSHFNAWAPVRDIYNFRPFSNYGETTTTFAQIDPGRVLEIRVDSSGCPCSFSGGLGVTLTAPAGAQADARQITVSGTVDDASVQTAGVRVNGESQTVEVENGSFSADVTLRTGENDLKVVAEAPDGRRGCVERSIHAPCELTDPENPFNGGGWVRLSVNGGPELEWPGYSAISLITKRGAVVWFGVRSTSAPYILFELYGRRATTPGRFEVRPNPLTDDAFTRTFAVGTFRSQPREPGMSFRHELVGGTLTVDAFEKGRKARRLVGSFDVTAESVEDGTTKRVVGNFDLCRFGIERRRGLDQAE